MLNSNILSALSKMGHTDQITIADAGLPIPNQVERIDLALIKDIPTFIETLNVVQNDMIIEKIILAEEIKLENKEIMEWIQIHFKGIPMEFVTHERFKELTHFSKAVVRTGECTPYANIILQSGVNFNGE